MPAPTPPPRPLSEADQLDSYLEKRDTWLQTQDGAGEQKRPDAPWLEFLDVRYRLLTAYQRYERRQHGLAEVSDAGQGLRTAFLRLTGALDQVTVPLEYWSERPHEKLEGEQNHVSMVANLKVLMHVFASLADTEGSDDVTKSHAVERMMGEQTSILEASRLPVSRIIGVDSPGLTAG